MRLEEMKCSACGLSTPAFKWYEEVGLVEYRYECQCGYVEHWSYGIYVVREQAMEKERK